MTAPGENYITEIASRIRAKIDPNMLPAEGLDLLFASYALLALSTGTSVTNEDVHNAWSVWASQFDPDNDSLVRFGKLAADVQEEDTIFRDAIHEVARALEEKIAD